jgi:hypothetical protein
LRWRRLGPVTGSLTDVSLSMNDVRFTPKADI